MVSRADSLGAGREATACADVLSEGTLRDVDQANLPLCPSDRSGGLIVTLRGWAATYVVNNGDTGVARIIR